MFSSFKAPKYALLAFIGILMTGATLPPPAALASPQTSSVTRNQLVGHWLGPLPGDTGRCGAAVSEFWFRANATFETRGRSIGCANYGIAGRYALQRNTIRFFSQHSTTCPLAAEWECPHPSDTMVNITFINANAVKIDGLIYHRQNR